MDFYSISLSNVTPVKLVTAKATYGIGFLTAFVGGFCSLFGIPNDMFTQKLKKAETLAMKELTVNAKAVGADGVMDVRCQIDGLSFLVCGTAYKCVPEESATHEVKEQTTTSKPTASKSNEVHEVEKKQYVNNAMNMRTNSTVPYWCGKCGYDGPYDGNCPKCNSSLKRYNV